MKIKDIVDELSKYDENIEVFVNDGEQVLSTTFYTPMEADGIRFGCDGTARIDILKYTISAS